VCNKKNVLHFNPRPREGDDYYAAAFTF